MRSTVLRVEYKSKKNSSQPESFFKLLLTPAFLEKSAGTNYYFSNYLLTSRENIEDGFRDSPTDSRERT
jgi:hypothetical protein